MKQWIWAAVLAATGSLAHAQADLRALVNDLRNDEVYGNAEAAMRVLSSDEVDAARLRPMLEAALKDKDRQLQRYAARLLPGVYARLGIPRDEWDKELDDQIVKDLRDDDVRYNAFEAYHQLKGLPKDELIRRLRPLLRGDDAQAQYLAAALIGLNAPESIDRSLARLLEGYLRADECVGDAYVAYACLLKAPGNVVKQTIETNTPADPQQAAFFMFLAAARGFAWTPPNSMVEKWKKEPAFQGLMPYPDVDQRVSFGTLALALMTFRPGGTAPADLPPDVTRYIKEYAALPDGEAKTEALFERTRYLEGDHAFRNLEGQMRSSAPFPLKTQSPAQTD